MTKYVEEIIAIEWELFDRVQNRGGRAACQDDKTTFDIMRSSQLMAWSESMRESYLADLRAAQQQGRNPLAEKYGYMMARTNPDEFAQIKDRLPTRDTAKDALIEGICAAHVAWHEAMAARYPHLAGRGRAIRKDEDSAMTTSFETYLWGELATYSMETIRRYAAYVEQLQSEGKNLDELVLKNTVAQYGYASMEAAEARFSGKQPQKQGGSGN